MTLYREHFTDENELPKGEEGWIYAGTCDEFGVLDRWMVPVVPCEHGNIDGHHPYYQTEKMDPTYCPGAGIGEETP